MLATFLLLSLKWTMNKRKCMRCDRAKKAICVSHFVFYHVVRLVEQDSVVRKVISLPKGGPVCDLASAAV